MSEYVESDDGPSTLSMLCVIIDLRRQLKAAAECIAHLQKALEETTAKVVAEEHFGYEEPRPPSWIAGDQLLAQPSVLQFQKTNTRAVTVSTFVSREVTGHLARAQDAESHIKRMAMDRLWMEVQKQVLVRQFQRKTDHGTVYVIALEVAPPVGAAP